MIVMLANNTGWKVRQLWKQYPTRFACLFGLRGWVNVDIPYACDNGRFASTTKNKPWDEKAFAKLLERCKEYKTQPMFVAVPDVVADKDKTLSEWDKWTHPSHWFMQYQFQKAFVVQDGMEPDDVPANAEWVFIGGTQAWKRRVIYRFCKSFDNVHVGGINSPRRLWVCHKSGAKSVDGTGWTRGDEKQWIGLRQYLYRSEHGLGDGQHRLFDLYEADAMGAKFDQKTIEDVKEQCGIYD